MAGTSLVVENIVEENSTRNDITLVLILRYDIPEWKVDRGYKASSYLR